MSATEVGLRLAPGDVVVISFPGPITRAQADAVRAQAQKRFRGHEVVVLTDGGRLGVMAREELRAELQRLIDQVAELGPA